MGEIALIKHQIISSNKKRCIVVQRLGSSVPNNSFTLSRKYFEVKSWC